MGIGCHRRKERGLEATAENQKREDQSEPPKAGITVFFGVLGRLGCGLHAPRAPKSGVRERASARGRRADRGMARPLILSRRPRVAGQDVRNAAADSNRKGRKGTHGYRTRSSDACRRGSDTPGASSYGSRLCWPLLNFRPTLLRRHTVFRCDGSRFVVGCLAPQRVGSPCLGSADGLTDSDFQFRGFRGFASTSYGSSLHVDPARLERGSVKPRCRMQRGLIMRGART
jgi:hypothetical protein